LLHQQLAAAIENQQRKCAMQNAAPFMACFLAQPPQSPIGFVDEDQGIRICHNAVISETIHVPKLIHFDNPISLVRHIQQARMIASSETSAPAPGISSPGVHT
jgi:hypothetical protein